MMYIILYHVTYVQYLYHFFCQQKNQNRELTKKRKQAKLLNEKREFEISQLKQGKKPYYQKKCKFPIFNNFLNCFIYLTKKIMLCLAAQKLLQMAEQFEDLKNKGSLSKHMKRHRKKKMIKDKIKMNLVSS